MSRPNSFPRARRLPRGEGRGEAKFLGPRSMKQLSSRPFGEPSPSPVGFRWERAGVRAKFLGPRSVKQRVRPILSFSLAPCGRGRGEGPLRPSSITAVGGTSRRRRGAGPPSVGGNRLGAGVESAGIRSMKQRVPSQAVPHPIPPPSPFAGEGPGVRGPSSKRWKNWCACGRDAALSTPYEFESRPDRARPPRRADRRGGSAVGCLASSRGNHRGFLDETTCPVPFFSSPNGALTS